MDRQEMVSNWSIQLGLEQLYRSSSPQCSRRFARDATIVLVGSRGSGKRSLGFIGATHLGRRLITEDHYFEQVTGLSRKIFLSRYGDRDFCKKNVEILQKMLEDNRINCIIECGMGSLAPEAQATLREYSKSHPVIYVLRNFNRIRHLLNLSEVESKRFEYADSTHRSCSNFEYYNLHDPSCESDPTETSHDRGSPNYSFGLKDAKNDFSRFLDFVTGYGVEAAAYEGPFSLASVPAERRPHTHALLLSLTDLGRKEIDISELDSGGGDVVELKIDTFAPNMLTMLAKQVALVRRKVGVPIIISVEENLLRELASSGNVDDLHKSMYMHYLDQSSPSKEEVSMILLHHSLRLGAEYVSINLEYQDHNIRSLLECKGGTKVIGHYFDHSRDYASWTDPKRYSIYQRAESLGCDLVRIVQIAKSTKDNKDAVAFVKNIDKLHPVHPPLIAYNFGILGYASMVSNEIFTPVTHPAIEAMNNGNQHLMTACEAMQALFQHSIVDPLDFYVSGAAVSYSLSPAMHTAAYRVCGMSHKFHVRQLSTMEELLNLTKEPNFGGSAVSMPFKVALMSKITAGSYHAKAIGAVNTILPLHVVPDGIVGVLSNKANERNKAGTTVGLYGDNTDWIGVMVCIRRNASPRNIVQTSKTTGLVIGAGGMARAAIYALIQLGCRKIFIFNRTTENAEIVAHHFNSWAAPLASRGQLVTVLRSRDKPWPIDLRPPTLIVSCVPAHSVSGLPPANFQMPEQWLTSPSGGVVMEVSLFSTLALGDSITRQRNFKTLSENDLPVRGTGFLESASGTFAVDVTTLKQCS
jgi:shikimate 5-dehydrogenase/shikimate kinase/3-dehydroquinate dehydratase